MKNFVIPSIDLLNGQIVRLHKGDCSKQTVYNVGIDELVLYDIKASCDDATVNYQWVESVAKVVNIPFCVAGKVDSIEKVEMVLKNGADKISINSPAVNNPQFN